MFGGQLLWQGSGRKDRPVEQKPVDSAAAEEFAVECGVGRVRLWVRLIAAAVPLTGLPFAFQPQLLNPEWADGRPVVELTVVMFLDLALAVRGVGGVPVPARPRRQLDASPTRGRAGCSCVRR
ncbi:hypothetical protein [Lentzea atacamensis]|uniref:hypothetical protein n=1 Tax=Lentzea atacamensis TaxID=531938 RepID=UPI000D6B8B89|nr:hypothetical protein [Lentzea atacamensis]